MSTSRTITNFFFTDGGNGQFSCKQCGRARKQSPGTGYTNLISHLATNHPGFRETYEESQRSFGQSLEAHGFADQRTMEIFMWMEWVMNMAPSEVDDPMTRALAAIKPVSSKTLVKYMRHVASKMGSRISTDMGNQFGLMFDGWTSGIYHFIAIYAVFTKEGALHEVLLAMSPAENGCSHRYD
ncbi:hypothetical protein F444_22528 [Phytophthora nicotianae P1976]|uniref:BED-type domain-containing protein n=1 Tax=Phytophthora nicotianae P1976 TaxID=1317066 RepID=A0A080YXI7_PHYNI|nr:hypothetical protein F444_22528 [Phytophthora nicotianae P1976]